MRIGPWILLVARPAAIACCLVALAFTQADLACGAEESDERENAAEEEAEKSDPFEIPADADAEQLAEKARELMRLRPQGETPDEQAEYVQKTLSTLLTVADRLVEKAESPRHKLMGFQLKMMTLQRLVGTGDEKAEKQLAQEIEKAKASDDPRMAGMGWQMYVGGKLQEWEDLTADQKKALQDELLAEIKQNGPKPFQVAIVSRTVDQVSRYDAEFAQLLLKRALPLFEKSDDEDVVEAASRLKGISRRLNLPGNEIKIAGTLLGGGEVDWDSYRGKVVLVDFWATWCGPCRAEVPNILEMYEAYHDKGFDVLGISLDTTPEAAEEYIEENDIPWKSLFPADEDKRGWDHPLVDYYAINGIPTAILVDADGRVVHMNARGRHLREQLQQMLGDPIEPKKKDEKTAKKEKKEKAAAGS